MNIAIESNEKAQLATLTGKDVSIPVILKDIALGRFLQGARGNPDRRSRRAQRGCVAVRATACRRANTRRGATACGKVTSVAKVKIDEVRLVGLKVTNPEVVRTFIDRQARRNLRSGRRRRRTRRAWSSAATTPRSAASW